MIWESIKEGFRLTHRNWQLIVIHIVVALINFIGLFVFIGLPLIIAIAYLGFDIAHIRDILPSLMSDPVSIVTRYLGLIFFLIIASLFYLLFFSLVYLYTMSGTLGVLGGSAMDQGYCFKLSSFFSEAKRHFGRLFWLLSLLFLIFTGIIIAFVIFGGIAVTTIQGIDIGSSSIEMFFNSFISLFVVVFGSIILYASVVFMVYSMVVSVIEEKGVMESIRSTYEFLKDNAMTFLYYLILLIGAAIINLIILLLSVIPLVASLINLFLQNYLSVVLWSCLIIFYIKRRGLQIKPVMSDSSPQIPSIG
jgi:hypothetical protein